jgi:hypothetical protein
MYIETGTNRDSPMPMWRQGRSARLSEDELPALIAR